MYRQNEYNIDITIFQYYENKFIFMKMIYISNILVRIETNMKKTM